MPLPFSEICVFLSRLEDIEHNEPPFLRAAEKATTIKSVTDSWFKSHRQAINELDVESSVAFISTLLPERRTDRVYNIQHKRLCSILSRCLSLSSARTKDLQAYKQPGCGDLATCVERVLKSGGPPAQPIVYLNEVDDMLQILAGLSQFSGPNVAKLPPGSSKDRDTLLGDIFKRLQTNEGKWLVRMILKDFSPVQVNEHLVLRSFHFLLPDLLLFQDDYHAAIRLLIGPMKVYPECPDPRSERLLRQGARDSLRPEVGIKIGRPTFHKARSIDHCMKMLGEQRWVLERKYDGEYCEIHVDLSRSANVEECITIFSKSGRDSTVDRKAIHQTLIDCLSLRNRDCKIKRQAILLGELVVYSDRERQVLPFEELRKHLPRSGRFIGTDVDSQPRPDEHLAIVFFDLLLLDDESVMSKSVEERRMWLREVYKKIGGRAMAAEWKIIDFSDGERAKNSLIQQFAASIAERCEGLILKPCGVPYFALGSSSGGQCQDYIKLKKDYIAGLGDEADFAVVGGSYNAQQALKSGINHRKWTDFHLGCLVNKADVLRFDARPRFKLVGTIQQEACIPNPILQAANAIGKFCAHPYERNTPHAKFDLESGNPINIDAVFDVPFVFEVLGSGFEKPSNSNFLMLRHPRVKKLHEDRTWKDCVSFQELQEQAATTRAVPVDSESQETRRLIQKLEMKCKKKFERQRTATPRSGTTITPTTAGSTVCPVSSRLRSSRYDYKQVSRVMPRAVGPSDRVSNADSDLDGTTLVAEVPSHAKRPRVDTNFTPCPAPKRPCIESLAHGVDKLTQDFTREKDLDTRRAEPLSDITNTAVTGPTPARREAKTTEEKKRPPKGILHKLTSLFPSHASQKSPLDQPYSPEALSCLIGTCLFANTVLYLTPCIAHTPLITRDLLSSHITTIVPTLAHWDRDSFSHAPMTEIVAESQAYKDKRKIVLVEAKRTRAVKDVMQQLLALNLGAWRERIEVWDWRVLEECTNHDLRESTEVRRWHFLGATMFDASEGKALFVSSVAWLR